MEQKKRLSVIKRFLAKNKIDFSENVNLLSCKKKTIADIYIKKLRIVVHASDGNDQEFYEKVKKWYKPFFIRESESDEFLVEKMQNCIIERMKQLHKYSFKQQKAYYKK